MLDTIRTRLIRKNIHVTIDPLLLNSISLHNCSLILGINPISVSIRLFNLIIALGISRTIIPYPTKRQKFVDGYGYIHRIIRDDDDYLRILVDRVNDDDQIRISKEIGEGVSIILADQLYRLQWSTISKIARKGMQSRPDYSAITHLEKNLVWEAKGSINSFEQSFINRVIGKKRNIRGDINFASFTVIADNQPCVVALHDPPSSFNGNREQRKLLMRTDHSGNRARIRYKI